MASQIFVVILMSCCLTPNGWSGNRNSIIQRRRLWSLPNGNIVSPFDSRKGSENEQKPPIETELTLTKANVEFVLNKVRPYLLQDGGNVTLVDIEETVVKLALQGACKSCPSSTTTMKFGLEKSLKEAIPEITDVISVSSTSSPSIGILEVDGVLNLIRPFLATTGGKLMIVDLDQFDIPRLILRMAGPCSKIKSIKDEVISRIHQHFSTNQSSFVIEWEPDIGY